MMAAMRETFSLPLIFLAELDFHRIDCYFIFMKTIPEKYYDRLLSLELAAHFSRTVFL